MLRLLSLLLVAAMAAGCATQPRYTYYDGPGDYYSSESPRYGGNYAAVDDEIPDYLAYPAYFNVIWPIYSSYYAPYYWPYYYPGFSFYPRGFFAFDVGYGGPWGLGFAPCCFSFWDSYYDFGYWQHNYPRYHQVYPHRRFGGARNEAVAVAAMANRGRVGAGPRPLNINNSRVSGAGRSDNAMRGQPVNRNDSGQATRVAPSRALPSANYAAPSRNPQSSRDEVWSIPIHRSSSGSRYVQPVQDRGGEESDDAPRGRYLDQSGNVDNVRMPAAQQQEGRRGYVAPVGNDRGMPRGDYYRGAAPVNNAPVAVGRDYAPQPQPQREAARAMPTPSRVPAESRSGGGENAGPAREGRSRDR